MSNKKIKTVKIFNEKNIGNEGETNENSPCSHGQSQGSGCCRVCSQVAEIQIHHDDIFSIKSQLVFQKQLNYDLKSHEMNNVHLKSFLTLETLYIRTRV